MAKLVDIEGIGATSAATLKGVEVDTVEELLEKGSTPKGRATIAESSGISPKLILEWVNLADLMRMKGVGEEDVGSSRGGGRRHGCRTVNPECSESPSQTGGGQRGQEAVRQLPSEAMVADWVTQAKALPRVVEY